MRKERKRGEKMGKKAIRYGKSAYEIIEFNYLICKRIWQLDKLNVLNDKIFPYINFSSFQHLFLYYKKLTYHIVKSE